MSTPVAIVRTRMKPLSRRHRIAHLRALLRLQPTGPLHGAHIAVLLRAEIAARPTSEDRAT